MIQLIIECPKYDKSVVSGEIVITENGTEWKELDLLSSEIILSKTFTDFENPSSIEGGYSINVQLPFTKNNSEILCELYKIDTDIFYSGWKEIESTDTKILINPNIKYNFKLLSNNEIIYQGLMVMDDIDINEGNGCFNVTLYDEYYDVFSKLDYTISNPAENNKDLPSTFPDDKFINIKAFDFPVNPQFVKRDWENGISFYNWMLGFNDNNYYLKHDITQVNGNQIVGFIPTYATFDNFDYENMYIVTPANVQKLNFREGIETPATKYDSCAQNNWKYYHLKPYIYYHNYLEFLFAEVYRVTGYKVVYQDVDRSSVSEFFRYSNPYWTNLIYTCNYLVKDGDEKRIYNKVNGVTNNEFTLGLWEDKEVKTYSKTLGTIDLSNLSDLESYRVKFNTDANIIFILDNITTNDYKYRINNFNRIKLHFAIDYYNEDDVLQDTKEFDRYLISEDNKVNNEDCIVFNSIKFNYGSYSHISEDNKCVGLPASTYNRLVFYEDGGITNKHSLDENSDYIIWNNIDFDYTYSKLEIQHLINNSVTSAKVTVSATFDNTTHHYFEPHSHIDSCGVVFNNFSVELQKKEIKNANLINLLGEDFNILENFSKFLKQFNLVMKIDYSNKEIKILQRGEYFKDKKTVNWSDYIDTNQETLLNYSISDNNKLIYTYDDRDDELNVNSRSETNYNNHSFVYNINNTKEESKNYIEGLNNSCINPVDTMMLLDYIKYGNIRYLKTIPLYVDNDVDGKRMDSVIGQLLFRNNQNIPYNMVEDGTNPVICTDIEIEDTEGYMNVFDTYSVFSTYVNSYPNISYFYNDSIDIAAYTSLDDYLLAQQNTDYVSEWNINGKGIYNNYFSKWNYAIYNGTKKLNAYFKLPLDKYKNFDFDNIVVLDNNLYIVSKLEEYSLNNNYLSAELIQIAGLDVFSNIDIPYNEDYFFIIPAYNYLEKTSTSQVYLNVISNHQINAENHPENYPEWITGSAIDMLQKPYVVTCSIDTTKYPSSQEPFYNLWDIYYEVEDDNENLYKVSKKVYFTNISQNLLDSSINVSPDTLYVKNEFNVNQTEFVIVESKYKPTFLQSAAIPVAYNPKFKYYNKIDSNHWLYEVDWKSTTGTAGERQPVLVSNPFNNTTLYFEREHTKFNHITTINCHNGNNPNLWSLDYTDYEELSDREEVFEFDIMCNYDWLMPNWFETLYDERLDSYPFNQKGDWYFEDVSSGKIIYPGDSISGSANLTYTFRFHYCRRYMMTQPEQKSIINIHCTEQHSASDDIQYTVNVVATTQNNNH